MSVFANTPSWTNWTRTGRLSGVAETRQHEGFLEQVSSRHPRGIDKVAERLFVVERVSAPPSHDEMNAEQRAVFHPGVELHLSSDHEIQSLVSDKQQQRGRYAFDDPHARQWIVAAEPDKRVRHRRTPENGPMPKATAPARPPVSSASSSSPLRSSA